MGLTLPEALLLIALDDEKGTTRSDHDLGPGLAGGVLLELALRGLLGARDGKLVAERERPDDPVLGEAHALIASEQGQHGVKAWLRRLPRDLKPLDERVAQGLAERGVLEEERGKLLGLIPRTRWPERDPAPERDLRAHLAAVLLDGEEPAPSDALLLSLLVPYGLVARVAPRESRRDAERRAKELADRGPVGHDVGDLVDEVRSAAIAGAGAAAIAGGATVVDGGN